MPVSTFGGGTNKSILWGSDQTDTNSVGPAQPSAPSEVVLCDDSAKIEELLVLIDTLHSTIDKMFPLIRVVSKQLTQLSVTSYVMPPLYVRLVWIEQHKGVRFTGSLVQLLQIKDIYFAVGEDWKQDKILVARLPAEYQ
jgi:hypothetical protein